MPRLGLVCADGSQGIVDGRHLLFEGVRMIQGAQSLHEGEREHGGGADHAVTPLRAERPVNAASPQGQNFTP